MPDSNIYEKLAAALRERLAVISDRDLYNRDPSGHLEKLKAASEKIVALQRELPPGVDPQLGHYLQRCSYDKALAFIEALLGSTAR